MCQQAEISTRTLSAITPRETPIQTQNVSRKEFRCLFPGAYFHLHYSITAWYLLVESEP